jgi:hypothetical protein
MTKVYVKTITGVYKEDIIKKNSKLNFNYFFRIFEFQNRLN